MRRLQRAHSCSQVCLANTAADNIIDKRTSIGISVSRVLLSSQTRDGLLPKLGRLNGVASGVRRYPASSGTCPSISVIDALHAEMSRAQIVHSQSEYVVQKQVQGASVCSFQSF